MAPTKCLFPGVISQQVPDPQTSALKLPNESLSSKVLCFSNGCFLTRPWVQWVHTQALWHFSLGHSRFGSCDLIGFPKSDVSGVPFLGASLKYVGVLDMVWTFLYRSSKFASSFQLWVSQPSEVCGKSYFGYLLPCLPTCLMFAQFDGAASLVLGSYVAVGIAPYVSCKICCGCGEGVSLWPSFVSLLGLHFLDIFFNISRHPQILNRNNYRNNSFWSSFTLLVNQRDVVPRAKQ